MSISSINALNCVLENNNLSPTNGENLEKTAAALSSSEEVGITIPVSAWCTTPAGGCD